MALGGDQRGPDEKKSVSVFYPFYTRTLTLGQGTLPDPQSPGRVRVTLTDPVSIAVNTSTGRTEETSVRQNTSS